VRSGHLSSRNSQPYNADMSVGQRRWLAISGLMILSLVVVSLAIGKGAVAAAISDLTCWIALLAAVAVTFSNALRSRGRERSFWGLYVLGCAMWAVNQAGWTYYEVIARKTLPDPFAGDIILFLHCVPFMAALAMRPHRRHDGEELDFSTVNFFMLLIWWVFLYAFIVVPDEYVQLNSGVYSANYDRLYLTESVFFLGALAITLTRIKGSWRRLYLHLFLAGLLYTAASMAINTGIRLGRYYSGSLFDVPFLASICWMVWAFMLPCEEPDSRPQPQSSRWLTWSQRLAMLAILSLPPMAFWAVFGLSAPASIRSFRLLLCLATMLILGACVFARQIAMDGKLIRLLKSSRESFENLERLQSQLVQKEKLASLGEVIAGAAHDINHPLAEVVESCDSLAANENLQADQAATARKIGQQARRTQYLISDLLSFAQQAQSEKAQVDLTAVLQRAIQLDSLRLQSHNIRVITHFEPGLPALIGNTNQLFQSFVHIIGNAEDALTEVGGGELTISARRQGGEVVIQFSDTGRGIREPGRVFDPFYTTKPIGKGTGLGLSATYGVVQDHGGHISCYNGPEGGAVFVIRLPIAEVAVPA